MTDKQAANKATKLWGRAGVVQFNPRASDSSGRSSALETCRALRYAKDPESRKAYREAQGICLAYRCTVGTQSAVGGVGFLHVKGQGDTWEEAFAAAQAKADREAAEYARLRSEAEIKS